MVNAIQAMDGGGAFTLSSERQESTVSLRIADTGLGIPEPHVANLFTPFFTTKPAGVGRGLGLYSAKSITEKYGGRIGVQSAVNQGTTFSLQFPAVSPSPT